MDLKFMKRRRKLTVPFMLCLMCNFACCDMFVQLLVVQHLQAIVHEATSTCSCALSPFPILVSTSPPALCIIIKFLMS